MQPAIAEAAMQSTRGGALAHPPALHLPPRSMAMPTPKHQQAAPRGLGRRLQGVLFTLLNAGLLLLLLNLLTVVQIAHKVCLIVFLCGSLLTLFCCSWQGLPGKERPAEQRVHA